MEFAPLPTVALVAVSLGYAWGVSRRRGSWARSRSIWFGLGVAVLAVALCSDLARHDTTKFSFHVVQHLLLAMVAPPLLALGAPITLLLQASSRPAQRRVIAVLHSRPVAVLTHPVVAWILFGGSMIALYATPLYAVTLRHPWLHDLLHLHFVVVGVLFFWPVGGVDPVRWRLPHGARILYVLIALPFHAIVGLALISARAPLWPRYTTLHEQQIGGGAMMLGGDLITLTILIIVFWQWAAADARLAARLDMAVLPGSPQLGQAVGE